MAPYDQEKIRPGSTQRSITIRDLPGKILHALCISRTRTTCCVRFTTLLKSEEYIDGTPENDHHAKAGVSSAVRGVLTTEGLDDCCWWERETVLLLNTD